MALPDVGAGSSLLSGIVSGGQGILSCVRMEKLSWALTGIHACLLPLLFGFGVLCVLSFFCCDFSASIDWNMELRVNKNPFSPKFL